jgi:exosortase
VAETQPTGPTPPATPAPSAPAPSLLRSSPELVAALLTAGAFAWSYAPGFAFLAEKWDVDPNYSFGYFVIPIALAILWTRRGMLDRDRLNPRWWGFLPLIALLAARYPLFEANEQYIERATIPLVFGGLVLALGGLHALRWAWPAVLFLFFLIPMPESLNVGMAGPLQRIATVGSVGVLQTLGLPVTSEGNIILVGAEALEVARACNGLSMLLSFVTLVTATVILVDRPWYERLILWLSAVPIAIFSNILRIVVTGLVYHWLGHEMGDKIATHELAGWAMMPLALLLVWIELRILSWLFVEEDVLTDRALLRRGPGRPQPRPARSH